MQKKIRFGIIGCGVPGQNLGGGDELHARYNCVGYWHALALKQLPDAELVAASSRHREHVKAFADKFQVEAAYTDYRELLGRDDIDVVIVCTPGGVHAEAAILAASAGKHVILEKPMDVSLEKADQIIEACRSHGVKLQVCLPYRLSDGILKVKDLIDHGALGRLILVNVFCRRFRTQEYFKGSSWRGTWALDGGGAFMNQGSHIIDLLLHLAGNVVSVSGRLDTLGHQVEVEDVGAAVVRFANRALGVIEATTCVFPDSGDRIELHGDRGTFIGQGLPIQVETWKTMSSDHEEDLNVPSAHGPQWMAHARIIADMIQAIHENREPLVPGKEGRRSLELISAIYQSAREGREVSLPL